MLHHLVCGLFAPERKVRLRVAGVVEALGWEPVAVRAEDVPRLLEHALGALHLARRAGGGVAAVGLHDEVLGILKREEMIKGGELASYLLIVLMAKFDLFLSPFVIAPFLLSRGPSRSRGA